MQGQQPGNEIINIFLTQLLSLKTSSSHFFVTKLEFLSSIVSTNRLSILVHVFCDILSENEFDTETAHEAEMVLAICEEFVSETVVTDNA